ncbi:MAG: hypothetical protein KF833_04355 [Verrucomicrobiae bacterium]|nr:hypothetical protein [Verrucomicrobiae bacterium]
MSDTPDVKSCVSRESGDRIPSPYCSLHYHFGMLLGVSDLETEQAYHRGKMWLHSAWLHREGVIWGFNVQADPDRGEIRVLPGLALDALGREIHLDADACLNVAAWFEDRLRRKPDDTGWFDGDPADGGVLFDAHVVIRFKTCLTRQVPAMSQPCENAGTATAYSRACETVEILLRPGLWPDPFNPGGESLPERRPYRRLRLLFGLDEPERDEDGAIVADDLEVVLAPRNAASFRRFAALDGIDLRPPEEDEYPVVLANLHGIALTKEESSWALGVDAVDVTVRPAHVATSALQDLLGGHGTASAPGAVVIPDSVEIDEVANTLVFEASSALAEPSVQEAGFSLTAYHPDDGWTVVPIDSADLDADDRTVTLGFSGGLPAGTVLVRLLIRGSGPAPVLDAALVPFNRGQDFTHDHHRS